MMDRKKCFGNTKSLYSIILLLSHSFWWQYRFNQAKKDRSHLLWSAQIELNTVSIPGFQSNI